MPYAGYLQLPVGNAAGDHQRQAADLRAIGQPDELVGTFDAQANHRTGEDDFRAESPRLGQRAPGQLGAAHAGGKAKIVLDARTGASLSARRLVLDDGALQSLRCAVHRRRQPGRAPAHDQQVVERHGRMRRQPNLVGNLRRGRPGERRAIFEDQDRQLVNGRIERAQQQLGFAAAADIQPLVRNVVARHEVAQRVALRRPAMVDQADPLEAAVPHCLPRFQEVVQHGIETEFRRVPGLEQVVVQAHLVDRADRHVRIRIRREKHPLGVGEQRDRLFHELDAAHLRHALVHQ